MRTLKLLVLGLILLAVVVLAVANREAVILHLLPPGLDRVMALSIELPLFVVILVSVVAGIFKKVSYVLEGEGITVASMLAILTGVLLFALGLICDQVAQLRLERYE